ncbi:MAG: DUF4391 domain-containing protein [Candidatus Nomurabacteria bacterium]|nr:MAG: DUF4391 domain-containing protein [Candidatus Nomurabacteria bacterium]
MNLPPNTTVNRFIPKEKFYTKTSVSSQLRQRFTDEIEKIRWTNKISPDTLNITSGEYSELQVFEIILKSSEISRSLLKHIDTFIPYPILYVLKKSNLQKAVISFKEQGIKNENQMKVDTYFETQWLEELKLQLKGRSVDEIYKNFLFQIAPQLNKLSRNDAKSAVQINKEKDKIQKQIDLISKKLISEPSIAKKQELARQRHALERLLI